MKMSKLQILFILTAANYAMVKGNKTQLTLQVEGGF